MRRRTAGGSGAGWGQTRGLEIVWSSGQSMCRGHGRDHCRLCFYWLFTQCLYRRGEHTSSQDFWHVCLWCICRCRITCWVIESSEKPVAERFRSMNFTHTSDKTLVTVRIENTIICKETDFFEMSNLASSLFVNMCKKWCLNITITGTIYAQSAKESNIYY